MLGTAALTGSLTMRTVGSQVGIKMNETAGRVSASHFIATGGTSYIKGPDGSEGTPSIQLGSDADGIYHSSGISFVINNDTTVLFADGGHIHADNDVTAFSTSVTSDIRLKENVKLLENNLFK